jgi:hypothetical protein
MMGSQVESVKEIVSDRKPERGGMNLGFGFYYFIDCKWKNYCF